MATVFLTGVSGFVGAHVDSRLRERGHRVTGLRRGGPLPGREDARGDLLDPVTYEHHLRNVDTIVHLAALTGKASPSMYERINVEGTSALLGAARRAGVGRMLFCSTIAVTFPDRRRYFYAESKLAAERLVQASGIPCTVIRPTIVAGAGSPVVERLATLAALPLVPAFDGARVKVQPILVDDLADFIVDLVEGGGFGNEVLELGGPEVLPLRDLLDRIHRRARGRPARFVDVPLRYVVPALGMLERVAYPVLPFTIGQLSTFRFDGIARPNALWEARRDGLASVDHMLRGTDPA